MLTSAKHIENQANKTTTTNTSFFGSRSSTPFFQPKPTVNQPGDAHEQKADCVTSQAKRMLKGDTAIAQRMMFSPISPVQRKCAESTHGEKEKVQPILAHELVHVGQQGGYKSMVSRKEATDGPAQFDFEISHIGFSSEDKIYFAKGSAALTSEAVIQIDLAKQKLFGESVSLIGYASLDESDPAILARQRADAVNAALIAKPDPVTVKSVLGNAAATEASSDFTEVRSVDILTVDTQPSQLDCKQRDKKTKRLVNPPTQPCAAMDLETEKKFKEALPIAKKAVEIAVTAVSGTPSATDATLIDRFFGNHDKSTLDALKVNMPKLDAQVKKLASITNCGGQCDTGGCAEGPMAYNHGVDDKSRVTLCVPSYKESPLKDQARILIHESAHGTSPLGGKIKTGAKDAAYSKERIFSYLSTADRLRNSDSYALFAMFLREAQITKDPNATPQDIASPTSDILTGFGATDQAALELALARLEKRLTWAVTRTAQLYGAIHDVRTRKSKWKDFSTDLMKEAVRQFSLTTAPPAVPKVADQVSIAGILDRYRKMSATASQAFTIKAMASGLINWPVSPAWSAFPELDVGPDFFKHSPDEQVTLLLEHLAKATRDVEPTHIADYVSFAEWIHRQQL